MALKLFKKYSGNAKQAVYNSSYQLCTNIVMKIGALLFTIIIARILLPEKYGLYVLALSTITIFFCFSDFGIKQALIIFGSKCVGEKDNSKAKGYLKQLLTWKITLLSISSLMLLLSSYFIANYYYNKPIFYALLVGALYLPIIGIIAFLESISYIENKFKYPLIKEASFQILRFIAVPITIILLISTSIGTNTLIASIIFVISICYFISALILLYLNNKNISFIKAKSKKLTIVEISDLKKFLYPLGAIALSGVFFGYVDIIMLGRYVTEEFIAYYGAAFILIGSTSAIFMFGATSILPILSKINSNAFETLLKKMKNFILILTIIASVGVFLLSNFIIRIVYGVEYLPSVLLLQIFSLLIIIIPITSIYGARYMVKEKTLILAKLLIGTTVLNIILNYFFITRLLPFGMMSAVIGACVATVISRSVYLGGLIFFRKV